MKFAYFFRDLATLSVAALTLLFVAVYPAQAAPTVPTGMPVFGSVDINKLQALSTKKGKYDADLHALADRLDAAFKLQTSSVMLTSTDQTALGTLLAKSNPTEADRNQIAALQSKATTAFQELSDLQQKKDPTPADTSRLTALTSQYETGKTALQAVGDQYQAQLKTLSDKDNTEFTQSVREAITAVAQQKGLSVVFTSDIAVYTANDITDEVVKRINK